MKIAMNNISTRALRTFLKKIPKRYNIALHRAPSQRPLSRLNRKKDKYTLMPLIFGKEHSEMFKLRSIN